MKKLSLKSSLIIISLALFLTNAGLNSLSTFADEEAPSPIYQNTSGTDPYDELQQRNAEAKRIFDERIREANKQHEEELKRNESLEEPNKQDADNQINKYWADRKKQIEQEYQNTIENNQRNYESKVPFSKTDFKPAITPKPKTLIGPPISVGNVERQTLTRNILPKFTTFLLGITAIIALIFILFSGARMMISMGEEEVYNKSKERIQWAIVGLVLAILAIIIVQIVTNINFVE
jgi:hypothetical protein